MIYLGIDIAKRGHFASALSSDGEVPIEPFKFTNDGDGFQLLVSKLDSLGSDSIIIGLESTTHYGANLVRYLVAQSLRTAPNKLLETPLNFGDPTKIAITPRKTPRKHMLLAGAG